MNIRKKVLSAVLASALALGSAVHLATANLSIIAQADEVYNPEALMTADRLFKYSVNKDGVKITQYCGSASEVVIPDEIDGKPVTQIGSQAFSNCESIESVTISANVIGMESSREFEQNKLIKAINVVENNSFFSSVDGVLFNKDKTELIRYPRGKTDISYKIPDSVTKLENRAFFGCESLESITVSDSMAEIGYYVFLGCPSLETINITEANSHFAFADGALFNKNKTELIWYLVGKKDVSYKIPDSVTKIDDACCSDFLKTLTLPESVTEIGINAFPCDLLEDINISEANSHFASVDGILFNKDKTEIVKYPAGKKEISYKIPNSVTSIFTYAFRNCTALENIVIPDSITKIERSAFYGCNALAKVTFTGTEEQWNQIFVLDDVFGDNVEVVFGEEPNEPENPDDTSSDTSDNTSSTPEENTEFTPEPVTDETVDEDTKKVIAEIKVTAPEMAFEAGTILTVKKDDTASGDKAYALDITFTLNGTPVQPKDGAAVTVQIPVPPVFKDADKDLLKVFHFLDGKYTKVEATVENGMVKFDTTHFSTYVISTEDLAGADSGSSGTGSEPSSDGNPSTGIAIAFVPAILAGAAVTVVIRKRK